MAGLGRGKLDDVLIITTLSKMGARQHFGCSAPLGLVLCREKAQLQCNIIFLLFRTVGVSYGVREWLDWEEGSWMTF